MGVLSLFRTSPASPHLSSPTRSSCQCCVQPVHLVGSPWATLPPAPGSRLIISEKTSAATRTILEREFECPLKVLTLLVMISLHHCPSLQALITRGPGPCRSVFVFTSVSSTHLSVRSTKRSGPLRRPAQLDKSLLGLNERLSYALCPSESSPQCPFQVPRRGHPASSGYFKGWSSPVARPSRPPILYMKKSHLPNFSVQRGGRVCEPKEGQGLGKTNQGRRPKAPKSLLNCFSWKTPLVSRRTSGPSGLNFPPTLSISRELCALLSWGQNKPGGRFYSQALP